MVTAGCIGWARTREYIPVHGKQITLIDGWILSARIYAFKDVVGADRSLWGFRHEFTFSKSFPRGEKYKAAVSVAEVDTVRVVIKDIDTTLILVPYNGPFWVSNAGYNELMYISEYSPSRYERDTDYPVGSHQLVLQMRVRVYPGVHRYKSDRWDSLTVDHTRVLRDTIIEAPLRFHESKSPAVNYGD